MADNANPILSLCVTVASKLKELTIQEGQLIFIKDKQRIAMDIDGKRIFYNQIEEISSEAERLALLAPISGLYYFVLDTAVLWKYDEDWIQITQNPDDIVFIGTDDIPEIGNSKTLYVNRVEQFISVWDTDTSSYVIVADTTCDVSDEDIEKLFL